MLCFSITAHERIDVLGEQIANILSSCLDSVIIVHLNSEFRTAINSSATLYPFFHYLTLNKSVIFNPQSLPTRWAHMFHAQISNYHHLEHLGIRYSAFVMISSGDLVFRGGIEDYVRQFDYGFDGGHLDDQDHWFSEAMADKKLITIAESVGLSRPIKGHHEGTFYSRDLLNELMPRIASTIEDWNYNDRYPKEELFLPTLAYGVGASHGRRLAHILSGGDVTRDRKTISLIIRDFAKPKIASHPALQEWIADSIEAFQDFPIEHEGRFIISRIPRDPANILRQLFSNMQTGLYQERVSSTLDSMTLTSRLQLDLPANKSGSINSISSNTERFLIKALKRVELMCPSIAESATKSVVVALPACPDGYLAPFRFDGTLAKISGSHSLFLCGAYIAGSSLKIELTPSEAALKIQFGNVVSAPTDNQQLSNKKPIVFLFFEVDSYIFQSLLGIEVEIVDVSGVQQPSMFIWIERHTGPTKEYFQPSQAFQLHSGPHGWRHLWIFNKRFEEPSKANVSRKSMLYLGFHLTSKPTLLEILAIRGLLRD